MLRTQIPRLSLCALGAIAVLVLSCVACAQSSAAGPKPGPGEETERPKPRPPGYWKTKEAADGMIERAEERLRKVYPALARTIVTEFGMEEVEGIGLDVGGGPGRLALELSKLTPKMKWVNVDINKHFFPHFFEEAAGEGVRERVDATEADVVKLPFEDGFADFVVSRGSYKYWEDKEAAFREIHRVLKPGGVAYVGRGFPDTLPVDEARKIRSSQRKRRRNPLGDDSAELRELLRDLPLDGFWIWTPQPPGFEERVYGLWLKFKKPAVAADGGGQQGPAPQ